jgi:hypothetical protein
MGDTEKNPYSEDTVEDELFNRLESVEDLVMRLVFHVGYPAKAKDYETVDELLAAFRETRPYKRGDPDYWRRNNSPASVASRTKEE